MDLNTVLCTCVYLCDRIHVWWIPYLLQVHALQRSIHPLDHARHGLGHLHGEHSVKSQNRCNSQRSETQPVTVTVSAVKPHHSHCNSQRSETQSQSLQHSAQGNPITVTATVSAGKPNHSHCNSQRSETQSQSLQQSAQ